MTGPETSTTSVTLACHFMPTKHERIAITNDDELSAALQRVAHVVEPGTRTATLVHDLAVRGAEALLAERRARDEAIDRLVTRTGAEDPGFDREVLACADREAWRTPAE